jgi:hypothetical protein
VSDAPLKIKVAGKLPPGTELLSCTQGIDRIRALSAVHELDRSSLELEMDLFATYAMAHLGERFIYSQQFGFPELTIGLLFLCGPELRNEMMFVFRTRTETDSDVDHLMALMEPILEEMGVQYYRGVCGDPNAQIHTLGDLEIQTPLLLARARN